MTRTRPGRPGRSRRWVAFGTASVLVAAAAGAGGWWFGREDRGSNVLPVATTTNWSIEAVVGEPTTNPPGYAIGDVLSELDGSAAFSNSRVLPWEGITVEQEDGTTYHFDGSSWTSLTPGGGVWVLPEREAILTERDGVIEVQTSTGGTEIGWVEDVLDSTPGITRDGAIYVIEDPVAYRDGFIETAVSQGVWVDEPTSGSIVMTRPVSFQPVWTQPGNGHAWIADRTAAILVIESDEAPVVAGRLVPDVISGSVWEPTPGAEAVNGHVEEVFAEIEGARAESGTHKVPFKIYVQPSDELLGKMERKRTSFESFDPTKETNLVLTRDDGAGCSVFGCFVDGLASSGGDAASGSWGWSADLGGKALDEVTLERLDCATGAIGGVVCTYAAAEAGVEAARTTAEIAEFLWKERGNLFAEKDCGTSGPHPPGDPGGATRQYPARDYDTRLAEWSSDNNADFTDRLEFARAWMPLAEFSQDEQCGEILRVFAEVNGYTPDGGKATTLDEAAWVEITYTLFFRYDGGRFKILGKDHPGDNEGFVIGLARTDRRDGLCRTGFEFVGGRTVGHSNVGGFLAVDWLAVNSRQIDDFTAQDTGTPCPDPPRARSGDLGSLAVTNDHPWRILVAEGKHATYYHRDGSQKPEELIPFPDAQHDPNGTTCEAALLPDLPLMVAAMAVGPFAALTVPVLMKMAPGHIANDLQNGLEECEHPERGLLDLSPLIELYGVGVAAGNPDQLGFNVFADTYQTETDAKTFMEQARGRVCFDRPTCNGYDFHVPTLFAFEPAPLPEPIVGVPDVEGWTPDAARIEIEERDLIYREYLEEIPDRARDGTVIRQTPLGGAEVVRGTVVEVIVGEYQPQEIPYVEGRDARDARSDITIYGFVYESTTEPVDDPELHNVVLSQDPPGGTDAEPGTVVQVVVGSYTATEPVVIAVPDVVGETLSAAIDAIEGLGLVYVHGGTTLVDDPALDGRVAQQSPGPGLSIGDGEAVTILEGRHERSVPDLMGSPLTEARNEIESLGFLYQYGGFVSVNDANLDDRVADQWPDPNTSLRLGEGVTVYLGRYEPSEVSVPYVVGLTQAQAISAIEASGLDVEVAGNLETTDIGLIGGVVEQSPASGEESVGTTIQIWIGIESESGPETPTIPPGGFLDSTEDGEYELTLQAGFRPDPNLTQYVFFGGSTAVDVSYLRSDCVGYATSTPTFEIHWTGSGGLLRFFFIGSNSADTTMVVRDPSGQWHCNDDSYSTRNPTISFPSAGSGEYNVWIGSFGPAGSGGSGDFYITEIDAYYP